MDPQNPYLPPTSEPGEWQPQLPSEPVTPTAAPKVFGILSIIFASLVLFGGLLMSCGGLAGAFGFNQAAQGGLNAELNTMMADTMGSISTAFGLEGLIFTVMSSLLLAIGVGQLRYRRWAGQWSVYWGGAALVALAVMVVISFAVIGPAYQRMFEAIGKTSPSGTMPVAMQSSMSTLFGGTFGVMLLLFYSPYPILMLIYFTRDRIRAAMNQ